MCSYIQTASPEEKGVASSNLIQFYTKLQEKNYPLHSAVFYVDGAVVSETYCYPFQKGQLHRMFSIAKSVTALAIGILWDAQRLSLEDRIVTYFPEKLPEHKLHPYLEQLTIRDMLMMRTCYTKTTYNKFDTSSDWVGSFFTSAPDKPSGTVFHYDTGAAHVLAALVEKLTNCSLMDFLRASLPDLKLSPESYMLTDGQGVSMGGTGLMATTEDLLKLGILLLNQGAYDSKQLISSAFVNMATSNLTPTVFQAPLPSEACGYGYMIWQTQKDGFVCYGMGGQFILVHPQKKLLLVTTADTQGYAGGNQILYDTFYECIYNPMDAFSLPENPKMLSILRELEAKNCFKTIDNCLSGSAASQAKTLSGFRPLIHASYRFPSDGTDFQDITINLQDEGGSLSLNTSCHTFHLPFRYTALAEGRLEKYDTPIYGSGVWICKNTLYLYYHLLGESVGSIRMELFFEGDTLLLNMRKAEETLFQEFQGTYSCSSLFCSNSSNVFR